MADTQNVKVTAQDIDSVNEKLYEFAKELSPGEQNVMKWLLGRAAQAPEEKSHIFKDAGGAEATGRAPAGAALARRAEFSRVLGVPQFERVRAGSLAAGSSVGVTGTVMSRWQTPCDRRPFGLSAMDRRKRNHGMVGDGLARRLRTPLRPCRDFAGISAGLWGFMSNPPHASLAMTDIGRVVQKLRELRDQSAPGEQAVFDDLLSAAGVVETSPLEYNPYLPGVHVHPYPHYHKVQAENPVHWSHAMQAWIISRHADVARALRDARLSYRTGFKTIVACVPPEEHDGIRAVTKLLSSLLNEIDPPEHTRLRSVMTRALTMTDGPQQASHIESVANQLLDQVQFAGCMDIVKDFAYPLPAIIGDDLLNIPAQDRSQFGEWIASVIRTFSEGFSQSPAMHRGEAAVVALTKYLRSLLAERRSKPGHDVLSAMLRHGEASEDESILIATNIIMGMHENLTHAISLSMNTLLRNPDLLHWVRTHPESFDFSCRRNASLRRDGANSFTGSAGRYRNCGCPYPQGTTRHSVAWRSKPRFRMFS